MNTTQTSQSEETLTSEVILSRAEDMRHRFTQAIADVPYEEKGVFFSEMLFVYAAVGLAPTPLVLESGRARGQSTYVLGKIFPDSKIVSVEFDRDSPDVPVAEGRLKGFEHIELLYGDSQKLLFKHLKQDAVIIIDGPKGFRALRLALQLLKTGKARMVFVHDVYRGLATRRFVEQNVPGALFSDHKAYVESFKQMDEPCWRAFDERGDLEWRPKDVKSPSYGPTFACLPYDPNASYGKLLTQLHLANFFTRTRNTICKTLGKRSGD